MKINREILRLAVPNILSNVAVPLAGMIDVAIMGHMGSVKYLAAIAVGGMIFSFIYWNFGFLRMGTTGLTAQAFGKADHTEASLVLGRATFFGLMIALLLIMLQWPIEQLSFWAFDMPEAEKAEAIIYFRIRIWAAPATMMLLVLNGWFIGMQNSVFPTVVTIVLSIVNVAANFFFVYVVGMKTEGVAMGTVIAQYTGLILALLLFFIRYRNYIKIISTRKILLRDAMRKFLSINFDIFIRTFLLVLVLTFFTWASGHYFGTTILAVNTVLFQFFLFFSHFVDGFAYAGEALTGRVIGMKSSRLLKIIAKRLLLIGALISVAFSVIFIFFAESIVMVITDVQHIIDIASTYYFWIAIVPLISFAAFIWDGIYIGATASKAMRNSMLIAALGLFFPVFYLTKDFFDNHSLWLAFVVFLFSRGLLLWRLRKKEVYSRV